MSNEMTIQESKTEIISSLPMGQEAETIMHWAKMMSETKFYQTLVSSGGPNAVVAIFLAARELGIPPMQAINGGLYIVQGRVFLSSQMMNLLIRRKGHSIKRVIHNATICTLKGKRRDNGDEAEVSFTYASAESIGLTKNPVWKNYPEVMLYNRASSMLAKQLFADCIGNASVEDEIDFVDITPEQPTPLSKETGLFINAFDLMDENSMASKFIDAISKNTSQERRVTIEQCARDSANFEKKLVEFTKKLEAKQKKSEDVLV